MSGNENLRGRRERAVELAGMLKEKRTGTKKDLDKILAKFALQEGLRHNVAEEYLEMLKKSEMIKKIAGSKRWVYNREAEWDLFKVII